jgi:hypothetical protein
VGRHMRLMLLSATVSDTRSIVVKI